MFPYDPYSFSICTIAMGPPLATVYGATSGRSAPHHALTSRTYALLFVRRSASDAMPGVARRYDGSPPKSCSPQMYGPARKRSSMPASRTILTNATMSRDGELKSYCPDACEW